MLASCKSKWWFERQYDISGCEWGGTTKKRGVPDGECCVEKCSTQKVLEECGMKTKWGTGRLRSVNGDRGSPIFAEEHQYEE